MHQLSWLEAIVIGALQGVSELFPVSSLGHSVLLPAVIGGSWAQDLDVGAPESPYLAFIVGLHVATALALIVFFWRDWVRIVRGLVTSIVRREVVNSEQRLAWLLVLGTIPVGIVGLLLEHTFRTVLSRPVPTAIFLVVNGLVLLGAEALRRRAVDAAPVARVGASTGHGEVDPAARTVVMPAAGEATSGGEASDRRLAGMPVLRAVGIGAAQIAALCPGISRSGVTMATGLLRGLSHEDAARFSFLLSTPVILAAGVLKLGDLAGPLGDGVRPQILVGSVLSFVGAYLSVRFLTRYFENRSLRPFGIYCIAVGVACLIWFGIR
ncbi:undecaprenyl-diphosphate phosphatase [Actinomycetospora sp. TBRC 11914]|uniref:undecaprenyl-diphosphate phosphatase n=1 Tax=Actinomycetospora sp. TBRC 11914 TaxID=2729387 RepID=UPI00145D155C|nr:undecaprenyl-diphosphate phosphatase [Actinomycetospora sp. TBRC 11914]NMO92744.1 undecaprenyl-diphosphate phosphatase [Actinomycetospora sp. TBRC 11914]